jgi:hypothetical protein
MRRLSGPEPPPAVYGLRRRQSCVATFRAAAYQVRATFDLRRKIGELTPRTAVIRLQSGESPTRLARHGQNFTCLEQHGHH